MATLIESITTFHELRNIDPTRGAWVTELRQRRDSGILSADVEGFGAQCVVFQHPEDPSKVIAIDYYPLNEVDSHNLYYTHLLFHALFPKNIPYVYATTAVPDNDVVSLQSIGTWSIRERIPRGQQDAVYPFDAVSAFIVMSQNVFLPFSIEPERHNFRTGEDGGIYYLDSIGYDGGLTLEHRAYIRNYMRSHLVFDKQSNEPRPYTEAEYALVERALNALQG